ncbi:MAG: hypothetical protein VB078_10875 [Clostridiaceae bacterium]|nr:hypothetical protein [Clostridiaceae bacterium]
MSDTENKVYCCKKMRLLEALALAGFTPFGMMPDRKAPSRVVWLFKKTSELENAIEDYYAQIPVNR